MWQPTLRLGVKRRTVSATCFSVTTASCFDREHSSEVHLGPFESGGGISLCRDALVAVSDAEDHHPHGIARHQSLSTRLPRPILVRRLARLDGVAGLRWSPSLYNRADQLASRWLVRSQCAAKPADPNRARVDATHQHGCHSRVGRNPGGPSPGDYPGWPTRTESNDEFRYRVPGISDWARDRSHRRRVFKLLALEGNLVFPVGPQAVLEHRHHGRGADCCAIWPEEVGANAVCSQDSGSDGPTRPECQGIDRRKKAAWRRSTN